MENINPHRKSFPLKYTSPGKFPRTILFSLKIPPENVQRTTPPEFFVSNHARNSLPGFFLENPPILLLETYSCKKFL